MVFWRGLLARGLGGFGLSIAEWFTTSMIEVVGRSMKSGTVALKLIDPDSLASDVL